MAITWMSLLLLRRGPMMAILMVKYYLLSSIQYFERIEAAKEEVAAFYLL